MSFNVFIRITLFQVHVHVYCCHQGEGYSNRPFMTETLPTSFYEYDRLPSHAISTKARDHISRKTPGVQFSPSRSTPSESLAITTGAACDFLQAARFSFFPNQLEWRAPEWSWAPHQSNRWHAHVSSDQDPWIKSHHDLNCDPYCRTGTLMSSSSN